MKVTHSAAHGRKKLGFTLIELLVVIAIIAILAAILFPVFAKVREKARQSSCESNMHQITLSILQYQQDYDEMFPMGETYDSTGAWYGWPTEIAPYIRSTAVLTCPDDPNAGTDLNEGWYDAGPQVSYAVNGDVAADWGDGKFITVGPMGAVNAAWDDPCMANAQDPTCSPAKAGVPSLTDAQVTVPDQSILVCEQWSADLAAASKAGHWGGQAGNGAIQPAWSGYSYVIDANNNPIPRGDLSGTYWPQGADGETSAHYRDNANDGIENFAFCDGHVKAMQPRNTFPLGWTGDGGHQINGINDMWDATRDTTTGAQYPGQPSW